MPVKRQFIINLIKHFLKTFVYGITGIFVVLIAIVVLHLESRPDLKVWHQVELDDEFTADSAVESFEDYLAMEKQLFAQLEERVFTRVQAEDRSQINRYNRGSRSDPGRWSPDWNRTFELSAAAPKAGVLLLHGMSDSPYSLSNLGHRLHSAGAWVIGLRLPGHGTAPSGLVQFQWEDMAASVRLAMRHLSIKVGDRPLYLVGYSNGGALAIEYALSRMEDSTLPKVTRVVLISPAIGVSPLASLAIWQERLGRLLGLKKLEWNSILPEYDPFKYNSFAINAGDQVYRITNEIRLKIKSLAKSGKLNQFPPVLAFQSIVDATVSTPAVVDGLLGKLSAGGHELTLFDINHLSEVEHLLTKDPMSAVEAMFHDDDLPFTLSLVTNADEDNHEVVVRQKEAGGGMVTRKPLHMKWPASLFSLSHVAMPFPMNDPIYGIADANDRSKIQLGNLDLRGERSVLQISAGNMLRLRCNPFYPYMEGRILEFFFPAVNT